jgi:hypothetical protein
VGGRREYSGLEKAAAAAGLDEDELFVELDLVFDAEAFVEVEQVDAAAQQDVLTVVDGLAFQFTADFVGRRSSTEEGAAFEDLNVMSCGGKGCGCGETSESAAEDDYRGHGSLPVIKRLWLRGDGRDGPRRHRR